MRGRPLGLVAVAAATVVGAVAGLALLVVWTVLDDPCPGFESEGPMVAPASAYGRVMCEPVVTLAPATMSQVELTAASLGVLAVALVAGLVTALATGLLTPGRPRGSRRLLAAGLVATLVLPALLVALAQHTLPRECPGQRTGSDCVRDREQR